MEHREIISVFKSCFKKVEAKGTSAVKHFQEEDIHDFRVNVKKLRAFFRLISTGQANVLKLPEQLHKLYGYLGNLRNLQMQQQRILELTGNEDAPDQYLKTLQQQQKCWQQKAATFAGKNNCFSGQKKLQRRLPQKLEPQNIDIFLQTQWATLVAAAAQEYACDETLHDCRKALKDILYDWAFIAPAAAMALPNELSREENIKDLTEQLGNFQDDCTALCLLEPDYTQCITEEREKEQLQSLQKFWQLKKQKEKSLLLMQLQYAVQRHPV
jgi:CHAD domain-containing protein